MPHYTSQQKNDNTISFLCNRPRQKILIFLLFSLLPLVNKKPNKKKKLTEVWEDMWIRFLSHIFVLLLFSRRGEERRGSCLKPICVSKGLMKMLVNYIMASGLKNAMVLLFHNGSFEASFMQHSHFIQLYIK